MRREQKDPRVTDLRRYRRERERARRSRPGSRPVEPLLGGRRNAGLILGAVIVALLLLSLLPRLH